MTENATIEKKAPASQPATDDLSKEIERSVDRQLDERVKAIRVYDNFYRCNWWLQEKTANQFWLVTGTITRSKLLRAVKAADGLLIEDATLLGKVK